MLLAKVRETIKKYNMLNRGDCVVVAVSGGPDSVCLLSVLLDLAKDLNLSLHVSHLDHMIRGRESAEEALFVADLAKKLRLPGTIEKIDVPGFCRERGLSAQAGAREVRYAFLSRLATEVNANRIATGHTASDQAETFLLRLIRGAGVTGLSAIPPKRENIIRPLIEVTRDEVFKYLGENAIEYVSDPSNTKPVYARNRIRMDVLPVLKQFNPRIVETLAFEAGLLRDENQAAEECLTEKGLMMREADAVVFKRDRFNSLPVAFKRRMLRKAVDAAGVEPARLSSVQIDEAVAFMASVQTGRAMHLPFGLTIEREYETLIVRQQVSIQGYSHLLVVPGATVIPELGIEVETLIQDRKSEEQVRLKPEDSAEENFFWHAVFDYDKIGSEIRLRNRLPGDRFCPCGMEGKSKKLQDFFVDMKVPRRRRDNVPLLVAGNNILWVAGLRTDERFQPEPDTKKLLEVRIRSINVCR